MLCFDEISLVNDRQLPLFGTDVKISSLLFAFEVRHNFSYYILVSFFKKHTIYFDKNKVLPKKLIGVQTNHDVEYFGGPTTPTH